ncbi:MAG: hypothetical protein H0U67_11755 [Gemmatimonadetes bacterium]|nr:hypothetical protein [Gemmatimonadota bacterium]
MNRDELGAWKASRYEVRSSEPVRAIARTGAGPTVWSVKAVYTRAARRPGRRRRTQWG